MNEEPKPVSITEQKQSISKAFGNALEKTSWQMYPKEDIPYITEALADSNFNIQKIEAVLRKYTKDNTPLPGRSEKMKSLEMFLRTVLYPVITYYYLKQAEASDKEVKTPTIAPGNLHANLVADLYMMIEEENEKQNEERVIPEEVKSRVLAQDKLHRKKAYKPEEVSPAEEIRYLKEKLFIEKFYIDLLLDKKITLR